MIIAADALLVGGFLGASFFAGLWWTVRRALAAANPALWLAGSLLLRMTLVLVVFHVIAARGWQALTLCLLGFLISRVIVTHFARLPTKAQYET
jgi:F1F0 ATPase subunit 2